VLPEARAPLLADLAASGTCLPDIRGGRIGVRPGRWLVCAGTRARGDRRPVRNEHRGEGRAPGHRDGGMGSECRRHGRAADGATNGCSCARGFADPVLSRCFRAAADVITRMAAPRRPPPMTRSAGHKMANMARTQLQLANLARHPDRALDARSAGRCLSRSVAGWAEGPAAWRRMPAMRGSGAPRVTGPLRRCRRRRCRWRAGRGTLWRGRISWWCAGRRARRLPARPSAGRLRRNW
jgi:hypothetical protein